MRKSVAIVGCGPKGLYALDSLCQAARTARSCQFDVHIFEPSPYLGAGPIYDPHQPDILLMNFPAHMIDGWMDGRGPSLMSWLADQKVPVVETAYLPRATVGRYLRWSFDEVVRTAPDNVKLTIHQARVAGLRRLDKGWRLEPTGMRVDELLITTGHQDWTRAEKTDDPAFINSPFPIENSLTTDNVPPGSSVACKGLALTFIDLMLALTEGRGGVFIKAGQHYAYALSGAEPALIAPFSRSGRPMRAKVAMDRFTPPKSGAFWQAQVDDLAGMLAQKTDATFHLDIWPALQCIADKTLEVASGTATAFFETWAGAPFDAERALSELQRGYDVALGLSPPDIGWALGEAWRRCYPAIVAWVSHRELAADDAKQCRHVAAEMERLAFGPPAQNIGKLICLERCGLLSLDHLNGGLDADVTVDATIPPAGGTALSAPLAGLLRDGYVEIGALGGLRVDARAQALSGGGTTQGLSIIGRATEGSVLGNDTLSRSLHDLPEQWAKRIARTCANLAPNPKLETAT